MPPTIRPSVRAGCRPPDWGGRRLAHRGSRPSERFPDSAILRCRVATPNRRPCISKIWRELAGYEGGIFGGTKLGLDLTSQQLAVVGDHEGHVVDALRTVPVHRDDHPDLMLCGQRADSIAGVTQPLGIVIVDLELIAPIPGDERLGEADHLHARASGFADETLNPLEGAVDRTHDRGRRQGDSEHEFPHTVRGVWTRFTISRAPSAKVRHRRSRYFRSGEMQVSRSGPLFGG